MTKVVTKPSDRRVILSIHDVKPLNPEQAGFPTRVKVELSYYPGKVNPLGDGRDPRGYWLTAWALGDSGSSRHTVMQLHEPAKRFSHGRLRLLQSYLEPFFTRGQHEFLKLALTRLGVQLAPQMVVFRRVDVELLESQRLALQRTIEAAYRGEPCEKDDIELLEGLENLLDDWSDDRFRRRRNIELEPLKG